MATRRALSAICAACTWLALTLAARADPALWLARSPHAAAYLFGTVHVLPSSVANAWMTPAIGRALTASTELWTEADIGSLSASVAAIRRYGLAAGPGAAELLPPAYRDRFARRAAQGGLPAVLVAHARPWLAEILLDAVAMQRAGPMAPGAESTLLAYARDHHMATPTFETLDQQFALLADRPQAEQLASLEKQIDEYDTSDALFIKLLDAWRAGDVATLDRLTNQDMRAHDEASWTVLILRRNQHFARTIGERLQGTGTVFVAVGAAHLVGPTGVPALLQRAGFAVTRVQ